MSKGKKHPAPLKRRPATMADVERAKDKATLDVIRLFRVLVLTVLLDKEGYAVEDSHRMWKAVEYLADSVAKGYTSIPALEMVLREEYGFEIIEEG